LLRPPRFKGAIAVLVALLVALPLGAFAVGAGPAPLTLRPLSNPDFPLGTWRMFHANPEHTGEGDTTLPPAGHVVWQNRTNLTDKPEGGAAYDAGVVYVGLGKTMTALNATSGERLWQYGAAGRIFSTPLLWNGMLFAGAEGAYDAPNFFALSTSNGTEVWNSVESQTINGPITFVHSSPTLANGLVYYGSYSYWLYARDALNGSLAWSANLTSEVIGSPAESNGILFAVSAGIHNLLTPSWDVVPRLWAFNATTGAPLWNQTVTQGQLLASPVVAGGAVFAATGGFSYLVADVDSGFVLAFDAVTGSPLWTSPDVGRMVATPAVYGSIMYVAGAGEQAGGPTGTSARLRWLDLAANGAILHEVQVGNNASMESSPAAVSGRVVAAGRDGTVAVFLASGAQIWSYNLGAEIIAPPAVANEMVFIPALDGYLYAFGAQPDFSVSAPDIVLSDATPHVDQPLKLRMTVKNVGDKKGSAVVSAEVNRSGAVTPVGSWNLTDLDKFSQTTLESPVRFPLEGDTAIVVRITGVTPVDGNGANNNASAPYTVLPKLDGWAARYADARGSNFLETDTPQNNILLWKQDAYNVSAGGFIAYGDTLVFAESSGNRVVAVPRERGNDTVLWNWAAPGAIVGSPVLANGLLVVATSDRLDPAGNVTFIDPDTGNAVASAALGQKPTSGGVPYGDFVLLSASDRLVEVSVADLALSRTFPTVDVTPSDQPALRTGPSVVAGWAFVISSVGELHAFNLTSATEPAGWPVQLGGPTDVPPVAGASFLYVVNGPTNVSAFPLSSLAPSPVWNATFKEPITGAMAVGYGRVFVPTATNVTALVAGSGVLVWNHTFATPQPGNAVRALGNSTLYAGSERLYAISASTGDAEWEYEPGALGQIQSSAALLGGTLHLQTSKGAVLTFGLIPGRPPISCVASPLPRTYRTREAVNFSAACTYDPDNETLTYLWDFGDGNTSTDPQTDHAYAFTGDFRVTLMVSDARLSSSRSVDIHLIQNQAPALILAPDRVTPDVVQANLDTAIWTFKVRYLDPDNDPPYRVNLTLTNETDPVKTLLPLTGGPFNFSSGVDYFWRGALSSGIHSYTFHASDGLDTADTIPSSPFSIFRIENRSEPPVSYRTMYVGQGSSQLRPVTGLISPPGLGPIDRFSVTLPQNASLQQWIEVEFFYAIAVNLADYDESTIAIFWFDWDSLSWVAEPSVLDLNNHTVVANLSRVGLLAPRPEGLPPTFGVFGEPTVPPLPPVARIATTGLRTIFSPGEEIAFSASNSQEQNDGNKSNLTFLWDFGDGSPTEDTMLTNHTYNRTGNFLVTLKVFNRFGQNATATVSVTIRTEASANTFLGIAIAIVVALFAVFVLWPVFRRRGRSDAQEEVRPRDLPAGMDRPARGARRAPSPPPKAKIPGPPGSDDETQVVDELDNEFEKGLGGERRT
jgi:outer membrane protein assembly factor BamB/PKD repeat protein